MNTSYKKGRAYEIETVNIVKKYAHYGWHAVRAFMSGQGGREDIKITIPTGHEEGITLDAEQKVMRSIPKRFYEWKGKNELLIVKKIARGSEKWPRLVVMDFEEFLELVGSLALQARTDHTDDSIPKHGDEPF